MEYQVKVGGGDTAEPLNVAKRLSLIAKEVDLSNKKFWIVDVARVNTFQNF